MTFKRGIAQPGLLSFLSLLFVFATFSVPLLQAEDAVVPTKMEGYQVVTDPANIAPTTAMRSSTETVEVFGQPRMTKGHPNTFWDQEDIEHYKEMLNTSQELQLLFAYLKDRMDKRIAVPINIPPPQKDASGKWMYPGDYFPSIKTIPDLPVYLDPAKIDPLPNGKFTTFFSLFASTVSDLGTLYALTGDEKYGEYAKKILLSFAVCSKYSGGSSYDLRSNHAMCGQLLDEALVMDQYIRGYDLIYNLPSWTKEERIQMHDEFFQPMAWSAIYPNRPDADSTDNFCTQPNNRGVLGSVSVLLAGYVTDDQELVNAALYGIQSDLYKDPIKYHKVFNLRLKQFPETHEGWVASTAEHPTHGLLTRHLTEECIKGGMWIEGSPGYAFYTTGSLIDAAEAAWHHGIDLYRYNNCILKYMFDYPLLISYPDLTVPGLNDSERLSIAGGSDGTLYEYAYRRYRDPRYLAAINTEKEREYLTYLTKNPKPDPNFLLNYLKGYVGVRFLNVQHVGAVPPSLLFDLDPNEGKAIPPSPSVNYPSVGFGILRTPSPDDSGVQNLTFMFGPTIGHGHPDKLHIDLWALNDVLMPSPGVKFPYQDPIDEKWCHTTLAANTLTVDEKNQDFLGANSLSTAHADQTVFAPALTVGMERGWTDSVYKGVTMDRAIFLTPHYLADLFGAFSASLHQYDLAWHIQGKPATDLKLEPTTFPQPMPNGYNVLTNIQEATTDQAWNITLTRKNHAARLFVASGLQTEAMLADGGLYIDASLKTSPAVPTIIERRDKTASTLYSNALDFSDSKEGYVKGVTQLGSLDAGYGLLKVATVNGTDLCFAAYRPGNYKPEELETDALQAFVQTNGKDIETLYLAGGKSLKTGNVSITRSASGLAYVEKTLDGNYVVGNLSPTDATVTVTLPALKGLSAFALDVKNQKGAPITVTPAGGAISLPLKAGEKVLFAQR